jgi:RimJ/RimL family protein N-acetyltransferase
MGGYPVVGSVLPHESYTTITPHGNKNRTPRKPVQSFSSPEGSPHSPIDLFPLFHYSNGWEFPLRLKDGEVTIIFPCQSIEDKLGRTIFLRPFEKGDFTALFKMYDEFEPKGKAMGLPPDQGENRHRWITGIVEEWFNIIALSEDRIIGHAALDRPVSGKSREFMIFVHQDYQNRGIGQAMTLSMLDTAKVLDCEKVWVVVENLNRIAITVFRKAGFCFASAPDVERLMIAAP